MKSLSTTVLLLGLCIGVAPSLRATPCTGTPTTCLSDGNGGGSTAGFLGNSLAFGSITATAWATDDPGNTFRTAALQEYDTFGLGVCSNIIISTCSNTKEHAVDNHLGSSGIFDFVLLRFSAPVTAVSFVLSPFLTDNQQMDYTYFAGNCAPNAASCTPSGKTLLNLSTVAGFGGNLFSGGGSLNSGLPAANKSTGVLNLGSNAGGVNWILIGTSTSGTFDDYFKIYSVSYTSTVPEPATFGLAGAALVALGLLRRRKTFPANS